MKRMKSMLRKPARSGAAAVLSAALMMSMPAVSAYADAPFSPASAPASRTGVSVTFLDYGIGFPSAPIIVHERMMIPGAALLQGLGYETTWDAQTGKLTATQVGKAAIVFEKDRLVAEIGGQTVRDLPAAPFVRDDMLWIPLRATLESLGMTVDWDPMNRMAVVKDPHALPKFSVAAKAADSSLAGQPAELEALLKTALQANATIDLIGPEHYRDKINLMIAAGDLKSLMLIPNVGQFPDNLIPSIAIDLTDLLDDYPRVKELASTSRHGGYESEGRIYGIPLPQDPHDAPFPAVRQDWLNVLGLTQPKTMDEMYEVLKVFTNHDPDGNGKHDTYGMTGYSTAAGLGAFAWVEQAYTGSPGRFSVKDGQVTDHAVGEEEAQALQWLARAYSEGLIDPEFALLTRDQAASKIRDNRSGVAALTLNDAASLSVGNVDWTPLSGLQADVFSDPISPWATQDAGTYIVTKMSKVEPERILAWLEQGIERTADGKWEEQDALGSSDRSALRSLFGTSDLRQIIGELPNLTDAERETYSAAIDTWRKTPYEGTAIPGIDRLWSSGQFAELNRKLEQMKIKVVMGAASIQDWNDYVQELVASDEYQQMMAELGRLAAE